MKKSRFTEQIAYVLPPADAGTPVADLCRATEILEVMFYVWKKKYASMGVSELRTLRQFEYEKVRLTRLVADLTLDKHMLQEVISKNLKPSRRRQLTQWILDQYQISCVRACRLGRSSHAGWFEKSKARGQTALCMRIREIAINRPRSG